MREICIFYLLMKSGLKLYFTRFDIELAKLLVHSARPETDPPAYLVMIANLEGEERLPEAWADFVFDFLHN